MNPARRPTRRVVTGLDEQGRSCILIDGPSKDIIWTSDRSPADNSGTADAMVQMASVRPMLGQPNHFNVVPPDSEAYERGRYLAQAETLYGLLDERLESRMWIAGGDYSIADMALCPPPHYVERRVLGAIGMALA